MTHQSSSDCKKFLVIKANQVGLGSLMVSAIYGQLCAQAMGRIPVILWRQRSLYYDEHYQADKSDAFNNAFHYYFKPISDYSIDDIVGKNYRYFPSCWNDDNIKDDALLFEDSTANFVLPLGLDDPNVDADVLVISEFYGLSYYLPHLLSHEPQFEKFSEAEFFYHYFYNKLHLKDELHQRIEAFYQTDLSQGSTIGVRIRRTDLAASRAVPSDELYIKAIDEHLARLGGDAKLFLATDCAKTLEFFKQIYRERLVYTDCIRSLDSSAVHLTPGNHRLKGEEMLLDLYILGKCDYFIGSDSNWFLLVSSILNNPLTFHDRIVYLNPTPLQKLSKKIELALKPFYSYPKRLVRKLQRKVELTLR